MTLRSPTRPDAAANAAHDLRIGQVLGRDLALDMLPRAAFIGFPSDEGVRRHDGHPGAAAPDAIRQALYGLAPGRSDALSTLMARTRDLGDLQLTGSLARDQEMLGILVGALIRQGTIPIVLGGGRETCCGHVLGYVAAARDVAILNWNAHPAVRPLVEGRGKSGSAIQQSVLLEAWSWRRDAVVGPLPPTASRTHINVCTEHGGDLVTRETKCVDGVARLYAERTCAILVSFDLKAVDAVHRPGESASSTGVLLPDAWFPAAFEAGRCEAVTSLDIVGVDPTSGVDQRTARLAALTLWYFLRGVSERRSRDEPPRTSRPVTAREES